MKVQKIVTGNETKDDAYLCHVTITNHLVIASDKCLWIINRSSREPWCLNWEEISHFNMINGRIMQITIFSQTGLKPHTFEVDSVAAAANFSHLLSMQESKMVSLILQKVTLLTDLLALSFSDNCCYLTNCHFRVTVYAVKMRHMKCLIFWILPVIF